MGFKMATQMTESGELLWEKNPETPCSIICSQLTEKLPTLEVRHPQDSSYLPAPVSDNALLRFGRTKRLALWRRALSLNWWMAKLGWKIWPFCFQTILTPSWSCRLLKSTHWAFKNCFVQDYNTGSLGPVTSESLVLSHTFKPSRPSALSCVSN